MPFKRLAGISCTAIWAKSCIINQRAAAGRQPGPKAIYGNDPSQEIGNSIASKSLALDLLPQHFDGHSRGKGRGPFGIRIAGRKTPREVL